MSKTKRGLFVKIYPAVVHLGVEAAPLVLQHGQVLLGLGGTRSCFFSSTSQQHGLSLIQQAIVLLCTLSHLGLELLQTARAQTEDDEKVSFIVSNRPL